MNLRVLVRVQVRVRGQHLAWGSHRGIDIGNVLTVGNIPYLADLVINQP